MRFAVWLALARLRVPLAAAPLALGASLVALLAVPLAVPACSGPIAPPTRSSEASVMRPPANAPPDPLGTRRPGDRSCTEDRDCKAGETCFAPDFVPSNGPAPQCQTDDQCPGQICAGASCVSPCRADTCGPGQRCLENGHCAPIPCTDSHAPSCPQNFRCNTASDACERQPCTSRSQCDTGVCYQGRCFSHDAYCMPQSYGARP